jgi:(E)-4-hydroxy-3-methyl-but-2-enyl pyrophosphate reductase
MKLIIAKHIGFCFGVRKALLITEQSISKDQKPIYVLGSLIHNDQVTQGLEKRHVNFIKNVSKAKSGTLIISAHGRPPLAQAYYKRTIIRDATCPLVKKVHNIVSDLNKNGYTVIIIGDREHDETIGIKGYTRNKAIIVENEKQAKKLPKYKKIGVVAQTTQNLNQVTKIVRILREKGGEINWINTLCPEVLQRQKEALDIAKKTDGVLVIGSKQSANTMRLAEIASSFKKPVWVVNSPEELKKKGLKRVSRLGVLSGTSASDWTIKKIIVKLQNP